MKKVKQLATVFAPAILVGSMLFSPNLFAQVKIGTIPTMIEANSNLEVEATNGKKVIAHKDNGSVVIENTPSGAPADSIMTIDANGNVRRRNISAMQSSAKANPYIKSRGTITAWSQQATSVSYITKESVQQQENISYTPATGKMTIAKPGMYQITSFSTCSQEQYLNYSRHCSYIAVNVVQQSQVCSASPDVSTVAVSNSDVFSLNAGDKIKVGIGTASTQGYYHTWEYLVSMYKVY
ncbi:hypothetical protein SAMN04487995_5952 [Dyadobacter koreensis]|uniref:C1q domain-containing protein n=1 Tax=Dyadobacter koreensis TaxID=408657 RepID=A0A1H7AU43_9BACT|nr:hypothetical protein [Dyadobacter koreensis]SEJ69099.1 hypothetical protein SAMN04487995_5952 [Dyadobacter koreensis]